MARVQSGLAAAANSVIELRIPTDRMAVAGVQYPAGGAGTIVLEGTVNEVTWELIELRSSAASATTATSVAAVGLWYADVSYCQVVRLRKSVGSSACAASLVINHN